MVKQTCLLEASFRHLPYFFYLQSCSRVFSIYNFVIGSPHSSVVKESACNSGDPGSIPGSERSPGGGNGNPLQYSCLENPWTEEPGKLQSIALQESRVGQDLETKKSVGLSI